MWDRGLAVGGFSARAPISITLLATIVVSGNATIVGASSPYLPDCSGQSEPVAIVLRVRDTAQVPDHVLTPAQADVTRIYSEAGVEVVWPTAESLSAESNAVRQAALTVAIVTMDQADHIRSGASWDGRVGFAARTGDGEGRLVYVIYDRVELLTGGNGLPRARMLAIAMAHEIGHLLLPDKGHSTTGLMRAYWTHADLRIARHELMFFTPSQSKQLRDRISGSRYAIADESIQEHLCSEGSK
jgi:hypothetical protein